MSIIVRFLSIVFLGLIKKENLGVHSYIKKTYLKVAKTITYPI